MENDWFSTFVKLQQNFKDEVMKMYGGIFLIHIHWEV